MYKFPLLRAETTVEMGLGLVDGKGYATLPGQTYFVCQLARVSEVKRRLALSSSLDGVIEPGLENSGRNSQWDAF